MTAVFSLVKPDYHARVPVPPCVHSSTLTSPEPDRIAGLQFFYIIIATSGGGYTPARGVGHMPAPWIVVL